MGDAARRRVLAKSLPLSMSLGTTDKSSFRRFIERRIVHVGWLLPHPRPPPRKSSRPLRPRLRHHLAKRQLRIDGGIDPHWPTCGLAKIVPSRSRQTESLAIVLTALPALVPRMTFQGEDNVRPEAQD